MESHSPQFCSWFNELRWNKDDGAAEQMLKDLGVDCADLVHLDSAGRLALTMQAGFHTCSQ